MTAVIFVLAGSLLWTAFDERRTYQFIAELGEMEYDSDFLKTAGKIQGIRQVYPVLEIPARLKIEDYTMDVTMLAVDLNILDKTVEIAREVSLGNTPVLLLGKESLTEMRDSNAHIISENQQQKFLEDLDSLKVEYSVASDASDGGEEEEVQWKDCIVAGILSSPSQGVWLSYDQGRALGGDSGELNIKKALITIQGKENYERVQSYFEAF